MGEVYRARDLRLQRTVAVKILPDAMAGDTDRLTRFIRAGQTLAALNHPNVLVASDEAGGQRSRTVLVQNCGAPISGR